MSGKIRIMYREYPHCKAHYKMRVNCWLICHHNRKYIKIDLASNLHTYIFPIQFVAQYQHSILCKYVCVKYLYIYIKMCLQFFSTDD